MDIILLVVWLAYMSLTFLTFLTFVAFLAGAVVSARQGTWLAQRERAAALSRAEATAARVIVIDDEDYTDTENAEASRRAAALALHLLGDGGFQQVMRGRYTVPSTLHPGLEYRIGLNTISLWSGTAFVGQFCILATGGYPLWDGILSRIMMVRGAELELLTTANFGNEERRFEAGPMPRYLVDRIFGRKGLDQWDRYTSSAGAPATAR